MAAAPSSSSPTDTPMGNTSTIPPSTNTTSTPQPPPPPKSQKFRDLATHTIKHPPFSYAHLELFTSSTTIEDTDTDTDTDREGSLELDALQVKSYCTAALKQFLGIAGTAIPLDILKTEGRSCWVRVPREDLGAFAAAVTAWQGVSLDGEGGGGGGGGGGSSKQMATLRIRGCSDWLGTLVGGRGEDRLWSG